jgi:hypothetical protein
LILSFFPSKRTPPTQHPLVATQNRRKLTTTVTQPIARPPTQANHEPSPRYRQPPKPSASSASSASPASSAGDNHASKKVSMRFSYFPFLHEHRPQLPSIPAPSIIHHDPRFSSVHQSHKSDDESTSADADGESVEDLDFEVRIFCRISPNLHPRNTSVVTITLSIRQPD